MVKLLINYGYLNIYLCLYDCFILLSEINGKHLNSYLFIDFKEFMDYPSNPFNFQPCFHPYPLYETQNNLFFCSNPSQFIFLSTDPQIDKRCHTQHFLPIYSTYQFSSPDFPQQQAHRATENEKQEEEMEKNPNNFLQPQNLKITLKNREKESFKKDRNIKSNTVKLFLKSTRKDLEIIDGYHYKLINNLKIENQYSIAKFGEDLDKYFPSSQNYIKISHLKGLCQQRKLNYLNNFPKVLRISLRKFFRQTIYLLNSKYTRTKKRVRRQQLKAGLQIFKEIFENEENDTNLH